MDSIRSRRQRERRFFCRWSTNAPHMHDCTASTFEVFAPQSMVYSGSPQISLRLGTTNRIPTKHKEIEGELFFYLFKHLKNIKVLHNPLWCKHFSTCCISVGSHISTSFTLFIFVKKSQNHIRINNRVAAVPIVSCRCRSTQCQRQKQNERVTEKKLLWSLMAVFAYVWN